MCRARELRGLAGHTLRFPSRFPQWIRDEWARTLVGRDLCPVPWGRVKAQGAVGGGLGRGDVLWEMEGIWGGLGISPPMMLGTGVLGHRPGTEKTRGSSGQHQGNCKALETCQEFSQLGGLEPSVL